MPDAGRLRGLTAVTLTLLLSGCVLDRSGTSSDDAGGADASTGVDAGTRDAGGTDGGRPDTGTDSGAPCSPNDETCNGSDDDCDGRTDEDIVPTPCSSACGAGEMQCEGGTLVCDAIEPAEERCNGLDDDCDMRIDETLFRGCTTGCGVGQARCSGGVWLACVSDMAVDETCDGTDEDCDGSIDEGVTRPCVGGCGGGLETCEGGAFGACSAASSDEVCNAYDDDCDGNVDEGGACPCDVLSTPSAVYMFCTTATDWASAQAFCLARGYDLATLPDEATNTYVTERALERVDLDWWIGYNDRAAEGTWTWVSGRAATYENFHSTQPNSSLGEQDCATLDNGSQEWEGRGQWGDRDCTAAFAFVCDAPL